MATIKEIAAAVGVSNATVSRVLNKDDTLSVSGEVRDKIFAVSHQMGYVPTRLRKLSLEEGITVGVADWHIVPSEATNAMLSEFARMAKQYCKTPVHFCALRFGEAQTVDGVFALGRFYPEEIEFLQQQSFSILFLDSNQQNYEFDRVLIDHLQGIREAVAAQRAKGRKTFGAMNGIYQKNGVTIGKNRTRALEELLRKEGLCAPQHLQTGQMTQESGRTMAQQLLAQGDLPEVLFICNEAIALGALSVFEQSDLAAVQKMEIIVYRDIITQEAAPSSLPAVQMYTDEMWKMAIRTLMERIAGKRTERMTLLFPSRFQR